MSNPYHKNLKHFIFLYWPYDRKRKKKYVVKEWMKHHVYNKTMSFYDLATNIRKIGGKHVKNTWHRINTVVSLKNEFCTL